MQTKGECVSEEGKGGKKKGWIQARAQKGSVDGGK